MFIIYEFHERLLTRYPEDLKWQPRLVNVLFILTQNARSMPRYRAPLAARLICDDTVEKEKWIYYS